MGLNVHQNYLRVMGNQFLETKRGHDQDAEIAFLERMHAATEAMSDFGVAEHAVRGEQNWGLLPLCSILAVKTGFHAGGDNGGFLPGFPEFPSWLGKNSSRGRMSRLLQELHHHMNYKVSGDSRELRLHYLPVLRKHIYNLLTDKEGPRSEEVIAFMDEYGLDRDDLFENLDEFTLDSKAKKFSDLESKVKAAFTREYNKGVHKSQALVTEQGITKTRKKEAAVVESDNVEDLDVVNDDDGNAEEPEDDENDTEKIKALFQKKGRVKQEPKQTSSKGSTSRKNGGKK
jgi:replication factor C subunit 1